MACLKPAFRDQVSLQSMHYLLNHILHDVYNGKQPKVGHHTKNATIPPDSWQTPLYTSHYKAIYGVNQLMETNGMR